MTDHTTPQREYPGETGRIISSDTYFFSAGKSLLFVYTGAIRKPYVTVCFFVYSGAFFEVVARLPALSFSTQGSFFRNNIPYHYMEKISIADNQNYQKIRKIQESKHK